jgi:DME family drug/metabolite transporter
VGTLRIVIAGILLVLLTHLTGRFPRPRREEAPWVFFGALLVLAFQLLFFAGVRIVGVAVGTILQIGIAPLAAGALGALVLRESTSREWVVFTVLGVLGMALVTLFAPESPAGVAEAALGGERRMSGALAAMGAGISYAGFSLALKRLTRRMSPMEAATLLFAAAAIPAAPIAFSFDLSWLATLSGSFMIAHLSVMATALAYLLFSSGIRTVHLGSAISATLVEGATAALLGVLLVGEALGTLQVAGIVLVLLSVWLNGRRSDPRGLVPAG